MSTILKGSGGSRGEPGFLREVRRALGDTVDPDGLDGLDMQFLRAVIPVIRRISRRYFRLRVEGLENIPQGPAVIAGNHNGGLAFHEPFGLAGEWYGSHGYDEPLHFLVHDAIMAIPLLRRVLVPAGGVRASSGNASALLQRGRKIVVFPGGNPEAFRPFRDRHRVMLHGRKGFIRLAIRNRVPIVPAVLLGGHGTFMVLTDGKPLARLLRLERLIRSQTCPVFLGLPWGLGVGPIFHFPIPVRTSIRILEPVSVEQFGVHAAEDPRVLDMVYQEITAAMQEAMDQMVALHKAGGRA